jgi:hypothetical protein
MAAQRISVEGTTRPVSFCPVSVRVDLSPAELAEHTLVDAARDAAVPFQVEPVPGGALVHWMLDCLGPGQQRNYVLKPGRPQPVTSQVRVKADDNGPVDVRIGGELFTRYIYGEDVPKPCLYPLIGPFGHGVTRAYPQEQVEDDSTDHIHHRSLYVAWGDVNGSDNWGEEEGAGRMVHRYFENMESGPVFGRITSLSDWVTVDDKRLMQDRIEYRFYNTPPAFRLFDVDIMFYASDGDVRFGDTKEGGILALRVATPLEATKTGCIENAQGAVGEGETWGKRSPWCDYSGQLQGQSVGIAVFDHERNVRFPTYWHVRNYGLMTANPFGLSYFIDKNTDGSYVLPGGGRVRFRYRVLIHAGGTAEGNVRNKYLEWACPPAAKVQE